MKLGVSEAARMLQIDKNLIKTWVYHFSDYLNPEANTPKGIPRQFSLKDIRVLAYILNYWDDDPDFDNIKIGQNAKDYYHFPFNEIITSATPTTHSWLWRQKEFSISSWIGRHRWGWSYKPCRGCSILWPRITFLIWTNWWVSGSIKRWRSSLRTHLYPWRNIVCWRGRGRPYAAYQSCHCAARYDGQLRLYSFLPVACAEITAAGNSDKR